MKVKEYVYEICDALYDNNMNYELVAKQYNLTLLELLEIAKQWNDFGTCGTC